MSHRRPGQVPRPFTNRDPNPEFELKCQATPTGEELLFFPLPKDEAGQVQSVDDHDGASQGSPEPPGDPDIGLPRDRADCVPPTAHSSVRIVQGDAD